MAKENKMSPVIKWVGGKRQLMNHIKERLPKKYNDYYEPFAGGLAVLLGLQPKTATVNDINKELINLYQTIKNKKDDFLKELEKLDKLNCDKDKYIEIRKRYNDKIENDEHDAELAALFVWLNKHCFNGLYRVNKKGQFNVPYNNKNGTSQSVVKENIDMISTYFQHVTILNGDFEDCLKTAKEGDFIFIDSPYAPINPTSFEDYTKEGFAKKDHERLAKIFKELDEKGCYCMLTNHDTPLIRELYDDYEIETVDVKRMVNRDANNRVGVEVIIRNYK